MSHHFNSPAARTDGRINLTDLYVFPAPDMRSTVLVLNLCPDAGKSSPNTFSPDVTYDFNIDMTGNLLEDLRYRVMFAAPDANGRQKMEVHAHTGAAKKESPKNLISQNGVTNQTIPLRGGGRAWAGLAADPFVANVPGYFGFIESVSKGKPDYSVFEKPSNTFEGRDILSIVLEIPNSIFARKNLNVWGTVMGNVPGDMFQLSRWGRPLAAFIVSGAPSDFDAYNREVPSRDNALFVNKAARNIANIVKATGTAADPLAYGREAAKQIVPAVLPYIVGTPAHYNFAGVNGRAFEDDVFDVVLTLITNRAIRDGVAPLQVRPGDLSFPYVPKPFRRTDIPAIIPRGK